MHEIVIEPNKGLKYFWQELWQYRELFLFLAWDGIKTAPGNDVVRLHRVRVRPENGLPSDPITMQTPIEIEVEFWNKVPKTHLHITLHLYTEQQLVAFSTGLSKAKSWCDRPLPQRVPNSR